MGERLRHPLRRPRRDEWPIDLALAGAATVLNVTGSLAPDDSVAYDIRDGGAAVVVLAALTGLVLLARRTFPVSVFVVNITATAVVDALHWPTGWMPFTMLVAAFGLGAFASVRRAAVGLVVGGCCLVALALLRAPFFESWLALGVPVQVLIAYGLGVAVRLRSREAAQARERRLAIEREGVVATERAVLEDRLSVARELHDVVTNHLAVISVQAAAARRVSHGSAAVVGTIEDVSRTALDDLRRLLGALRGPGPDVPADPEEAALRRSVERETGWTVAPPPPPVRWRSWMGRDWPVDLAFGLSVMALNVAGVVLPDTSSTADVTRGFLPVVVLLAMVPGAALVVRRRHPIVALVAVLVSLSAVTAAGWESGTLPGSLLLATYAVGAWAPTVRGLLAMLAMYGAIVTIALLRLRYFDAWIGPGSALFALPWLIGSVVRRRRHAAQRIVDEALAAERARATETQRAIAEERLRVARDLHELVAHGLASVSVQASVARHLGAAGQASDALAVIEESSRAAMTGCAACSTRCATRALLSPPHPASTRSSTWPTRTAPPTARSGSTWTPTSGRSRTASA